MTRGKVNKNTGMFSLKLSSKENKQWSAITESISIDKKKAGRYM